MSTIYFEKSLQFLSLIGIEVIITERNEAGFLPGLYIEDGKILVDKSSLSYPGDILHEAGHLAVVPYVERSTLSTTSIASRPNREAEEMMAIAWSYAACVHLEIDPSFVFHENGYKGGGATIINNFRLKQYFGLPMLQWTGMAVDEKNAALRDIKPFPYMIKWMRD